MQILFSVTLGLFTRSHFLTFIYWCSSIWGEKNYICGLYYQLHFHKSHLTVHASQTTFESVSSASWRAFNLALRLNMATPYHMVCENVKITFSQLSKNRWKVTRWLKCVFDGYFNIPSKSIMSFFMLKHHRVTKVWNKWQVWFNACIFSR